MTARTKNLAGVVISLSLVLSLIATACAKPAPASKPTDNRTSSPVSNQPDPLTNTVLQAELIVLGNITDKRYEVITVSQGDNRTGEFTYTIFTLSVGKMIKGDPELKQVFIKVAGGLAQNPTGPWYFSVADRVLVSLHQEDGNIYTLLSPGVLWIRGTTIVSSATLQEVLGRVVQIMMANNVPIAPELPKTSP